VKVLKSFEMANADSYTIKEIGINSLVLMENAGRTASEIILENFCEKSKFTIVAGSGNNGGDGLVIARYLLRYGKQPYVYVLARGEEKLSEDNRVNLKIYEKFGGKYEFITENDLEKVNFQDTDVIIDAIFGTGFKPPVRGYREEVIKLINKSKKPVVSVDIPSGLSTDSGEILGEFVKADLTVTFAYPKLAHILFPASKYCGDVYVVDISIYDDFLKDIKREILTFENIRLPERDRDSHKYTYGHTLVVGGSVGKTGAVIMAGKSASYAGSGLVTVVIPRSLDTIIETNLIEEMSIPVSDKNGLFGEEAHKEIEDIIKNGKFTSIVVGMGMSISEENQKVVETILKQDKPILIDADGLNNLAKIENFKDLLKSRSIPAVLTPHIGEMSRLTNIPTKEILKNMEDVAVNFATENNAVVILKSSRVVIATPDGEVFYSTRGNEGMATAGTGDVLAGIVGTLIYRLGVVEGSKTGVFIHGIAGEFASEEKHVESVVATDLIYQIPKVYKYIENQKEKFYYKFFKKLHK